MKIKYKKNDYENDNNIFWVTMTDLMTALVLIFIVLFFYSYINGYYEKMHSELEQKRASIALESTLKEQQIDALVDEITGVVKISDLELFNINSYTLSERGKQYLNKFVPAYFNSIFSNEYMRENIDKIIIQGHTDSQLYKGLSSEDAQYMKNMELSLRRAYEVANYMITTPYNKKNSAQLRKMIVVEGASYSTPIMENGKENYSKSRRVELKIIMKNVNKKQLNK